MVQSNKYFNFSEGLWQKCPSCSAVLYRVELEKNLEVCPKCDHHLRINARKRLEAFFDDDSMKEISEKVKPIDALKFKDSKKYKDRISVAQKNTGEKDALITFQGQVKGVSLVAALADDSITNEDDLDLMGLLTTTEFFYRSAIASEIDGTIVRFELDQLNDVVITGQSPTIVRVDYRASLIVRGSNEFSDDEDFESVLLDVDGAELQQDIAQVVGFESILAD